MTPVRSFPDAGAFVPGTLLAGRYRIIARVGRGGMGEVYRADDLRLGQPVALKFLPAEFEHDDDARERLLAEVRLARTVAHPNVCRVYDVGDLPAEDGGPARTFLTMEYIDGEDLATLLRRIGRLPPAKALDIARQLCAGLAAAHDKGVLHRDLKPANVMIDGRGQARIADFGIAVETSLGEDADNAGTLAYMAPERFAGEPASVRSDLYALGLVLYEAVTGAAAFTVSGQREWQRAHTISAPSNPSAIVPDVDPAMGRAILRCLEKDPIRRPSSAAQLAASLPGGDPLAAALAAGETPSPELVAASGAEGTLPRDKAWALMGAAVVMLAAAAVSVSSSLLINHIPMPLDSGALERRAREVLASVGYTAQPADRVSSWAYGQSRVSAPVASHVSFLYRESPGRMFEFVFWDAFTSQATFPDAALLAMDPRGRLISLDVGGNAPYSDTSAAREPNWVPLLQAIGADSAPVPSTQRRWPPAYFADTRAAWTAVIDGDRFDVEAGALRGRPVSLRIRRAGAPDERPARMSGSALAQANILYVMFLCVPLLLGLLARRNVRLGRGDRRGAARLAAFCFCAHLLAAVLTRHWIFSPSLLFVFGVAYALFYPLLVAALLWLSYLGIEPHVRRRWPSLLVGATRALDGRLRDGLVGQALLAGVLGGTLLSILEAGRTYLNRSFFHSGYLYSPEWQSMATIALGAIPWNVFGWVVAVGLLLLGRLLLRRDWAGWLIVGAFLLVSNLSLPAAVPTGTAALEAAVFAIVLILLVRRFGLLAAVIASAVSGILVQAPLTLDPTRWYFARGALFVSVVLALAIWGFVNVLGKQSLLPAEALDA